MTSLSLSGDPQHFLLTPRLGRCPALCFRAETAVRVLLPQEAQERFPGRGPGETFPEVSSALLRGYFLLFTTCVPELTGEVQTRGCVGGYRRQGRFQDLGRQRSAGMMSFPNLLQAASLSMLRDPSFPGSNSSLYV